MGWGDAEHGFRGKVPPLDFTLDNTRWLALKQRAGAVPQRGLDVGCPQVLWCPDLAFSACSEMRSAFLILFKNALSGPSERLIFVQRSRNSSGCTGMQGLRLCLPRAQQGSFSSSPSCP